MNICIKSKQTSTSNVLSIEINIIFEICRALESLTEENGVGNI